MIKSFEEARNWGKESLEAYVASAAALTKGFQSIAAEVADYSRRSFEEGSAVMEKAFAAKSFDKTIEVQRGYAKAASEAYLSELNKIGELCKETAKEAFEPFEASVARFSDRTPVAK